MDYLLHAEEWLTRIKDLETSSNDRDRYFIREHRETLEWLINKAKESSR